MLKLGRAFSSGHGAAYGVTAGPDGRRLSPFAEGYRIVRWICWQIGQDTSETLWLLIVLT